MGVSASAQPRAAPEAPADSKDLVGKEALCSPDALSGPTPLLTCYVQARCGWKFMRDSPDSVS